jgi:RHS repeat-associated protein
MTSTTLNGQFGDFKDGTNAAGTADYVYDANGNVVVDLNKNAQSLNNGAAGTPGIHYNFLDKPDQIRIAGKGTIEIVYSADGEKLQRAFIPDAGGSGTVTTYINQFVFQETATLTTSSPAPFSGTGVSLAYINFEEGRVRVIKANSTSNGYDALTEAGNITLPVSPSGGGGTGVFDYFIMDYQQNVRMILTEETHSAVNTCTMETSRASAEDPVFGQTGTGNEVEVTRYPKPAGWTNNSTGSVSQTGKLCGHFLGPNTLQKVMAGDQLSASVQYYYQSGETSSNPNIITPILSSLAMAIGGPATTGTLTHGGGSAITNNLNTNPGIITAMEPNSNTSGTPQAYLTILFFDERFNFIAAADGGVAQQQVASSWNTSTPALTLANIKAPKNGYAYIYVSNRSDQDVYFDNLVVNMVAGNIIEENHYYAFGLRIAAISSRKLGDVNEGKLSNPYQYNDKEMLDEDAGLNWYDYGFRNYDPQIGRFMQLDPLADAFPDLTSFQFAGNDPIANVDMDGLEPANVISFFKSLGSDVNASFRAITTGMDAGGWAVKWSTGGIAYTKIFRAAINTGKTVEITSLAIKAASILNKLGTQPPSASGSHWQTYLQEVALRGAADAVLHANTLGILGGDHSDNYNNEDEKKAYYRGRLGGDIATLGTSSAEISGGLGAGGALALETAGVGLVGGALVAAHGYVAGGTAVADMSTSLQKLYRLSNSSNGSSSGGSSSNPQKFKTNPPHSADAENIGNGHAWGKHKDEFPEIKTQNDFKQLIDNVKNSATSLYKKLQRGREAWYDQSSNTIVIKDPNKVDGGTMFRPSSNIDYFKNLR